MQNVGLKFVDYIFRRFYTRLHYLSIIYVLVLVHALYIVITHEVTQSSYKFKLIDYYSSKAHLSFCNSLLDVNVCPQL